MQPFEVDGLRTSEDAVYLIRDCVAPHQRAGLELLDQSLNVLLDLSDECVGGTVSRSGYATLHGSCSIAVTNELDWGTAIVRPYIVLESGDVSARFNMGAYYTNVPTVRYGEDPVTFEIQGIDILDALNVPVGESFSLNTSQTLLDAVEDILIAQRYTSYFIDPSSSGVTPSTSMVWPLDEATTWLNIINDILSSLGYRGIYSDWDGVLRCEKYVSPAAKAAEWTYSDDPRTTIHSPDISRERDLYRAPNRWVAVMQSMSGETQPVLDNGIYVYQNNSVGPTSVDARGGRVINRFIWSDATTQAALISDAHTSIDADIAVSSKYTITSTTNPLHWHFDRIALNDATIGGSVETQETEWTISLTEPDMSHTLSEVVNTS